MSTAPNFVPTDLYRADEFLRFALVRMSIMLEHINVRCTLWGSRNVAKHWNVNGLIMQTAARSPGDIPKMIPLFHKWNRAGELSVARAREATVYI